MSGLIELIDTLAKEKRSDLDESEQLRRSAPRVSVTACIGLDTLRNHYYYRAEIMINTIFQRSDKKILCKLR